MVPVKQRSVECPRRTVRWHWAREGALELSRVDTLSQKPLGAGDYFMTHFGEDDDFMARRETYACPPLEGLIRFTTGTNPGGGLTRS